MNDTVNVVEVKYTPELTTFLCPICKVALMSYPDKFGVRLQCDQPKSICWANENPFGHGKNQKAAYETLVEKMEFCIKDRGVKTK
jgi:hypothetical protein